jgi:SAM-dependent methyltransferase
MKRRRRTSSPRRAYRAIAEYYDPENAQRLMLENDVPFFLGQLPKRKQSILELAAGTGRAAIPIAQAGHRVVATDYAPEMLAIARRKRDAVGLTERQLQIRPGDALRMDLRERFEWVCIFFNTFLAFTTLEQQDRVLQTCRKHLKPAGRLWLDVFQPDLALLSRPRTIGLDPLIFQVHELGRTVMKTTEVRPSPSDQTQRVIFHYTWVDEAGRERRERTEFTLTWLFPRELRLLLERNGFELEHVWGNYDGSPVDDNSPRLVARARLA